MTAYYFAWTAGMSGPCPGIFAADALRDLNGREIETLAPPMAITDAEAEAADLKALALKYPPPSDAVETKTEPKPVAPAGAAEVLA